MLVSSDLRLFSIWLIFCSNFVALEWGQWAWSSMVWQCQKPWCKIPGSDDQGPNSRKDPWAAKHTVAMDFFKHLWLHSIFWLVFKTGRDGPTRIGWNRAFTSTLQSTAKGPAALVCCVWWTTIWCRENEDWNWLKDQLNRWSWLRSCGRDEFAPECFMSVTRIWRTSASRHGNYDLHCWWLPHAQGRSVDLRVLSHLARPCKRVSLKNVRTPWEPKRHWAVAAVNLWLQARKSDSNIIVDLISFV